MTQDLNQLTNAELKRYLSEHRNNDDAFHDALQVLMSRRDPNAPRYPYPYDMVDPEREVEAIFRARIRQIEQDQSAD
ncbi:DUF6887 family protein [Stenomitos frigidus]|uniref:Uncharacterized protein n=1 Tax=Stenomitos frigidus ULC18 TaxID=2107698 RepID=A0A2T1DVY9_9CYAN|nr:hypothetical protein [Stenomitos frigidus]PSB24632.1 hypothetical protein C7B82_26815 [Stenomitos frigidus ULC18]